MGFHVYYKFVMRFYKPVVRKELEIKMKNQNMDTIVRADKKLNNFTKSQTVLSIEIIIFKYEALQKIFSTTFLYLST